jgi:predicted HNH restriction endonuclease
MMMTRFWTCHWQNRFWRPDINAEHKAVCHSAGNSFKKRGVSRGDVVYVVSLMEGQLFLGGKMSVDRILTYREAVDFFGHANFYNAEEHVIGVDGSGTPLNLHRRLSPALSKQLRFESKTGPKEPFFVSDTELDNQATRGVRELTPESAALLDRIIGVTDQLPRSDQLVTVTHELLREGSSRADREEFRFPEELPHGVVFSEGSVRRVEVNRYERDPQARLECIATHGTSCCICGLSFGVVYGPEAEGYIHVHHVRPLSEIGEDYIVDPVEDLRPVCPNCHAVLHLGGRCRTIEEVVQLLGHQRHG